LVVLLVALFALVLEPLFEPLFELLDGSLHTLFYTVFVPLQVAQLQVVPVYVLQRSVTKQHKSPIFV